MWSTNNRYGQLTIGVVNWRNELFDHELVGRRMVGRWREGDGG